MVRVSAARSRAGRDGLEQTARSHDAAAAISLSLSPDGAVADVWVAERLTQKTLIRRINVADVPPQRRPFMLALRAVELLRASLIELAQPPPSQAASEVPEPVSRLLTVPSTPLQGVGVELGLGALFSTDSLDPALAPTIRVSYGFESGIALRLGWLPPLMNTSQEGPLGVARVRQQLLGLDVVYAPSLNGAVVVPVFSAGIGAYHLIANGELQPPAQGVDDEVWGFALQAGGGAMARLNQTFAVTLQLQTVVSLPRAVVTMAGTPVGSGGQPSLLPSLGAVARF